MKPIIIGSKDYKNYIRLCRKYNLAPKKIRYSNQSETINYYHFDYSELVGREQLEIYSKQETDIKCCWIINGAYWTEVCDKKAFNINDKHPYCLHHFNRSKKPGAGKHQRRLRKVY